MKKTVQLHKNGVQFELLSSTNSVFHRDKVLKDVIDKLENTLKSVSDSTTKIESNDIARLDDVVSAALTKSNKDMVEMNLVMAYAIGALIKKVNQLEEQLNNL